jgi:pyruvate dehydrogenase E2 component (dihydrolipoamide acetyltransferase)
VESLESGILSIAPGGPSTGDTVLVGALLGYLLADGERAPFAGQSDSLTTPVVQAQTQLTSQIPAGVSSASAAASRRHGPMISPRARRVALDLNVEWSALTGSGRSGRIVERDIRAAAMQPPAQTRLLITPVARRLAEEAGIDPATVEPHKPGGRIQREDVEAAITARSATPVTEPPESPALSSSALPVTQGESLAVTRIRRLIAQRMASSAHTAAAVTLTTEADATDLVILREQLKATFGARNLPVPAYNDLLIKLTAVALQAHPLLNATWNESEIIVHEKVHVGLAVDTPEGLLVPVVRDAGSKGVRQIATETQSLIEKAQSHHLGADDLQGGTFTITNLGMYGIDAFTPIINLPQSAILGVGRIIAKPAVVDGQVVPRKLMILSLTFDHRVVDGGPAARFLNTIREFIEEPTLWLVG